MNKTYPIYLFLFIICTALNAKSAKISDSRFSFSYDDEEWSLINSSDDMWAFTDRMLLHGAGIIAIEGDQEEMSEANLKMMLTAIAPGVNTIEEIKVKGIEDTVRKITYDKGEKVMLLRFRQSDRWMIFTYVDSEKKGNNPIIFELFAGSPMDFLTGLKTKQAQPVD